MKTSLKSTFIILLCLLLFSDCKKKNNCPIGGGNTGNIQLVVTPEHHGSFVDSCKVYIAYGTNDIPVGNVYNDSAIVKLIISNGDTTPVAIFNNLTEGNYYLYGSGYHASLQEYVLGGEPCNICAQHSYSVLLYVYQYTP